MSSDDLKTLALVAHVMSNINEMLHSVAFAGSCTEKHSFTYDFACPMRRRDHRRRLEEAMFGESAYRRRPSRRQKPTW